MEGIVFHEWLKIWNSDFDRTYTVDFEIYSEKSHNAHKTEIDIFVGLTYRAMLRPIDNYFLQKDEPTKSCLQFLREHILKQDDNITEAWKYGMPFYCYNKKMFCYLWTHKKYHQPYIGIVEGKLINHPDLIIEKRARMKILLLDPGKDLPIKKIDKILKATIDLYKHKNR